MANVLILGATSAIAAEVAKLYAGRGDRLHLVGRNPEKLAAVVAACEGASVTSETADFAQLRQSERLIAGCVTALGRIDTALIAHGELGDQLESERSFDAAEAILRANFTSAISLLLPLANHFELARGGTLGVITSVAGDRGRPRNYTYGAAKGALSLYLQGLRSRLRPAGVRVTTLKLGPVDTPMTATHRKHMLFGKPVQVARRIVRSLDVGRSEVYIPFFWGAIMPIVKSTPEWLFQRLTFLSGR